jgi:hypothetical protein
VTDTRAAASDQDVLRLLAEGAVEVLGLLPRASNYTFLAKVESPHEQALAVYKPQAGEIPLWDFFEGTLCKREVAAFEVSRALGWPDVPPTILREGPEGPGSLQLYVDFDPEEHYLTLRERRPDDFRRVALFDAVINNADRKSGHCLLSRDGRVFLIDHGVSFHHLPKLRTVIWEFAGEDIPPELVRDLKRFVAELRDGAVGSRLEALLARREIQAMETRVNALLETGRFPHPGPGRPYPWPVI